MRRPRPLLIALALLSLVILFGSLAVMAGRIVEYNKTQGRVTYIHSEVEEDEFTYAGLPVTLEDLPPEGANELGSIRLTYGDEPLELAVTIPPNEFARHMPGLERHADWMRLVRFARLTDHDYTSLMEAINRGEEQDRLILVTKSMPPGVNPETWGKVWRKAWVFDFYEFLPEGGFRHERFAYPRSRSAAQQEERREAEAEGRGGIPELDTRSWQFQMAHLLMPEGTSPRIIAGDSPLVAVGWTFPACIVAVLASTAFLLLAFAPARVPQEQAPAPVSAA